MTAGNKKSQKRPSTAKQKARTKKCAFIAIPGKNGGEVLEGKLRKFVRSMLQLD